MDYHPASPPRVCAARASPVNALLAALLLIMPAGAGSPTIGAAQQVAISPAAHDAGAAMAPGLTNHPPAHAVTGTALTSVPTGLRRGRRYGSSTAALKRRRVLRVLTLAATLLAVVVVGVGTGVPFLVLGSTFMVSGGSSARLPFSIAAELQATGQVQNGPASPSFLHMVEQAGRDGRPKILIWDSHHEPLRATKIAMRDEHPGVAVHGLHLAKATDRGGWETGGAGNPPEVEARIEKELRTEFEKFLQEYISGPVAAFTTAAGSGVAIHACAMRRIPDVTAVNSVTLPQFGERGSGLRRGAAVQYTLSALKDVPQRHANILFDNDLLSARAPGSRLTMEDLARHHAKTWEAVSADDPNALGEALAKVEGGCNTVPSDANPLWVRASFPLRLMVSPTPKVSVYKSLDAPSDQRDLHRLFGGRTWIPAYSKKSADLDAMTGAFLHPISANMQIGEVVVVVTDPARISDMQRRLGRAGLEASTFLIVQGATVEPGETWAYVAVQKNPYASLKAKLLGGADGGSSAW